MSEELDKDNNEFNQEKKELNNLINSSDNKYEKSKLIFKINIKINYRFIN